MIRLTIEGNTAQEMVDELLETMGNFLSKIQPKEPDTMVRVPEKQEPTPAPTPAPAPAPAPVPAPAPAPVEEPKTEQPSIEEVRAALKELRDRKGSGAVRELLKAYGADSLLDLKPEDYLGALARAKTEV